MKFPKIQKRMSTKEKILYIIEQNPNITMTEIQAKLDVKRSHAVIINHLKELEKKGKIGSERSGRRVLYRAVRD